MMIMSGERLKMTRDGQMGSFLRVAPSTPGKERRRLVIDCASVDLVPLNAETESCQREFQRNIKPYTRNQSDENPCKIKRKASMKRGNESLERWSDSISAIMKNGQRKHDSSPSFPSRGRKLTDMKSSPQQIQLCVPSLTLMEEGLPVKKNSFTAISNDSPFSHQKQYQLNKKSGPPITIDCVQCCKGLEHEDLTDFSMEEDFYEGL